MDQKTISIRNPRTGEIHQVEWDRPEPPTANDIRDISMSFDRAKTPAEDPTVSSRSAKDKFIEDKLRGMGYRRPDEEPTAAIPKFVWNYQKKMREGLGQLLNPPGIRDMAAGSEMLKEAEAEAERVRWGYKPTPKAPLFDPIMDALEHRPVEFAAKLVGRQFDLTGGIEGTYETGKSAITSFREGDYPQTAVDLTMLGLGGLGAYGALQQYGAAVPKVKPFKPAGLLGEGTRPPNPLQLTQGGPQVHAPAPGNVEGFVRGYSSDRVVTPSGNVIPTRDINDYVANPNATGPYYGGPHSSAPVNPLIRPIEGMSIVPNEVPPWYVSGEAPFPERPPVTTTYPKGIKFTGEGYRGGEFSDVQQPGTPGHFWPSQDTARVVGSNVEKRVLEFNNALRADNYIELRNKLGLDPRATLDEIKAKAKEVGYDGIILGSKKRGISEHIDLLDRRTPEPGPGGFPYAIDKDGNPIIPEGSQRVEGEPIPTPEEAAARDAARLEREKADVRQEGISEQRSRTARQQIELARLRQEQANIKKGNVAPEESVIDKVMRQPDSPARTNALNKLREKTKDIVELSQKTDSPASVLSPDQLKADLKKLGMNSTGDLNLDRVNIDLVLEGKQPLSKAEFDSLFKLHEVTPKVKATSPTVTRDFTGRQVFGEAAVNERREWMRSGEYPRTETPFSLTTHANLESPAGPGVFGKVANFLKRKPTEDIKRDMARGVSGKDLSLVEDEVRRREAALDAETLEKVRKRDEDLEVLLKKQLADQRRREAGLPVEEAAPGKPTGNVPPPRAAAPRPTGRVPSPIAATSPEGVVRAASRPSKPKKPSKKKDLTPEEIDAMMEEGGELHGGYGIVVSYKKMSKQARKDFDEAVANLRRTLGLSAKSDTGEVIESAHNTGTEVPRVIQDNVTVREVPDKEIDFEVGSDLDKPKTILETGEERKPHIEKPELVVEGEGTDRFETRNIETGQRVASSAYAKSTEQIAKGLNKKLTQPAYESVKKAGVPPEWGTAEYNQALREIGQRATPSQLLKMDEHIYGGDKRILKEDLTNLALNKMEQKALDLEDITEIKRVRALREQLLPSDYVPSPRSKAEREFDSLRTSSDVEYPDIQGDDIKYLHGGIGGVGIPKIDKKTRDAYKKTFKTFTQGARSTAATEAERKLKKVNPKEPVGNLIQGIREAGVRAEMQKGVTSQQRQARIKDVRAIPLRSVKDFRRRQQLLSGEFDEVPGISVKMDDKQLLTHLQTIDKLQHLRPYEKHRAQLAVMKLKEGERLVKSEIELMENVYGEGVGDEIRNLYAGLELPFDQLTKKGKALELMGAHKSISSVGDASFGFRQGLGMIHTKHWWKSWGKATSSALSEVSYKEHLKNILRDPMFPLAEKNGVAITDLEKLSTREDQYISRIAERIPVLGRVIKANNRMASTFLNEVRFQNYKDLVRDSKLAGYNPASNPKLLKDLADYVNNATGRGSLGEFEKVAGALNATFYSPRLLTSRIKMLNPKTYLNPNTSKFVRKQYLKSAIGIFGVGAALTKLGEAAGFGTVSTDETSSDFMKLKVGNTRFDFYGGHQQIAVLMSRIVENAYHAVAQDKPKEFFEKTGADRLLDTTRYKLAPTLSLLWDLGLEGKDQRGKPYDIPARTMESVLPLFMSDAYEIIKEDPTVALMATPLSFFGHGVQAYGRPGEKTLGKVGSDLIFGEKGNRRFQPDQLSPFGTVSPFGR